MVSIYQLLIQAAGRNPEKNAVIFENKSLSYKAFLSKVDQTAAFLLENKYNNKKILLAMPRNTDLLVSIFAILKINSTYIPIDLSYPAERIDYIIEDSSCDFVLTTRSNQGTFPNCDVICFEDRELDRKIEDHSSSSKGDASNLAYIIYTSGSTGKPKGVMIEEPSLINFIDAMGSVVDFNYGKTMACLTTVSFDIFFLESIMALCKGLTVVLANDHEHNNPKLIRDLILKHNIDIIQLTPSRARLLLNYDKNILSNLSEVIIGGEDFPMNLLKNLQENTNANIYNVYGPTEATIWTTICDVTNRNEICIGKALPNYETYILNEDLQVVPHGEMGELCISGVGLSLGYVNKEELTSQKFLTLNELGGVKIYRTGDYAKLQADGNLKYMGRIDNQVKIRGYRIELEEIESIIYESGLVTQAVVLVHTTNDINSLVLYYCSNRGAVPDELKTFLRRKLPDYMIPSRYIEVKTMPQTPNGKIDRRALSKMNMFTEENLKDAKLQSNGIDHRIVEIIKNVTELGYITPDSSMDEIDSISFIRILVDIENNFDIILADETLTNKYFETVAELINYVSEEVYNSAQ